MSPQLSSSPYGAIVNRTSLSLSTLPYKPLPFGMGIEGTFLEDASQALYCTSGPGKEQQKWQGNN